MKREEYHKGLKKIQDKVIREGRVDRFWRIVVNVLFMFGGIWGAYVYVPELTTAIAVGLATVSIVYELKTSEIIVHGSLAVLAGTVEATKRVD